MNISADGWISRKHHVHFFAFSFDDKNCLQKSSKVPVLDAVLQSQPILLRFQPFYSYLYHLWCKDKKIKYKLCICNINVVYLHY